MGTNQYTFFGDHVALESLTQHGDRPVELDRHIQWKPLMAVAQKVWRAGAVRKAACGGAGLAAEGRCDGGRQVRGGPSSAQQRATRRKSKTRVRVEHPFALMEKSLGRIYHRCIGLVRNKYQIGLMNLCHNLCRCVQLVAGRAHLDSRGPFARSSHLKR